METCFETLRDAGIDKNQFWEMDEKDLANMGHTMGMRLRYRKGKKERDEMLRTMRCKLCLSNNIVSFDEIRLVGYQLGPFFITMVLLFQQAKASQIKLFVSSMNIELHQQVTKDGLISQV